jgi:hypothetical protein
MGMTTLKEIRERVEATSGPLEDYVPDDGGLIAFGDGTEDDAEFLRHARKDILYLLLLLDDDTR